MGEYFLWVNPEKKEYICPQDFALGNKRIETTFIGNEVLNALKELLSFEWYKDAVVFLGDECSMPVDAETSSLSIFKKLYDDSVSYGYPGSLHDTVIDTYKNVSGFFKAAEKEVRTEIEFYLEDLKNSINDSINYYGIDPKNPYQDLFLKSGKDFKYTINYSKGVCYSLGITRILYSDNTDSNTVDPLPILCGYGRHTQSSDWLGDKIGVADKIDNDIIILDKIYLDW